MRCCMTRGQQTARRWRQARGVTHTWVAECVRLWLTAPRLSSVLDGWRCYDGGSRRKCVTEHVKQKRERERERKEGDMPWLPHCDPMLRKAVSQHWVGGRRFKHKNKSLCIWVWKWQETLHQCLLHSVWHTTGVTSLSKEVNSIQ